VAGRLFSAAQNLAHCDFRKCAAFFIVRSVTSGRAWATLAWASSDEFRMIFVRCATSRDGSAVLVLSFMRKGHYDCVVAGEPALKHLSHVDSRPVAGSPEQLGVRNPHPASGRPCLRARVNLRARQGEGGPGSVWRDGRKPGGPGGVF